MSTANQRFWDALTSICETPFDFEKNARKPSAFLEMRGPHNETLLHFLAVEGRTEEVKFLARLGANLNPLNEFGNTPLMECSMINGIAMVTLLLQLGANPNLRSKREGYTGMHFAAKSGAMDILKLLIAGGGDITIKDKFGQTCMDLVEVNGNQ